MGGGNCKVHYIPTYYIELGVYYMSKKLLMNNYSENGLLPIMDGLVCWLDAYDIETGDTLWKDRSGNGNDFKIVGSPVIKNGYFHFAQSKPYARCESLEVDIDSVTVQCSLKDIKFNRNSYIYSIEGYRGFNLSNFNNLRLNAASANRELYRSTTTIPFESFVTGISEKFAINLRQEGVFNIRKNFSIPISKRISGMEIGKECNYGGGSGLEGCIGLLLVYDRPLTEEEIEYNYRYSQSIQRG